MKTTLGTAFTTLDPIGKLSACQLPVKTSYWIGRRATVPQRHAQDFAQRRATLAGKHGATDTTGVPDENKDAFIEDLNRLASIEFDLPEWFTPVSLKDIPETVNIEASALMALETAGLLTE